MISTRCPLPFSSTLAALALFSILSLAPPASAHDGWPCSMEILVDGVPLREYAGRGSIYIEARREHEFSIRLRNRGGERIAVALSVDGLNTIDAKRSTAYEASKWILGPYQTLTLDGWQTSESSARRFFFTTENRSYGEWLGRTENLGIITAAVFRERKPRPAPIWRQSREGTETPAKGSRGKPEGPRSEAESVGEVRRRAGEPTLSDEMAATGIGRRVDHSVRRVRFDAERHPSQVLHIRYEYRDELVRLGLLPMPDGWCEDPLERRERARGFEGTEFAPDPFRRDP